jgi:putative PEP-CTERM system histidine kinase
VINTGVISFASGAFLFLVLTLVLFTGQQGRSRKNALKFASGVSTVWLGFTAFTIYTGAGFFSYLLEPLRSFAWLLFLGFVLVSSVTDVRLADKRFRKAAILAASYALLLTSMVLYRVFAGAGAINVFGFDILYAGFLLVSIIGLVMIEQIMRNAHVESRRAVKYICIGLGVIFAYDFYLYSNALLFQGLDVNIWEARGFVNGMAVPVLAIAIARDPRLSLDIFVSRRMVFHTTALLGTGLYLLAMGLGGYYIRTYGGEWGTIFQVLFMFAAGLILMVVFFSGRIRASLSVFINKHFFHYKYDYRDEWLRFIQTLSSGQPDDRMRERAIHSIAEIIDSPGGILWMRQMNRFVPVATWQMDVSSRNVLNRDHPLIQFMAAREWLIDLDEYERDPELYNNITLPDWLKDMPRAWLVVPLIVHDHMLGFMVLANSPAQHHFNWEDSDLVKTAGRQVAVHLAQLESSQALAVAKQFEACSRMSSYVMHDLKNLIAQLSLVVTNAGKHKNNPQFMEDAITTVDNSVNKMNRLLEHLRSDVIQAQQESNNIELCDTLASVVQTMSAGRPVPTLDCQARNLHILADRERFEAIIGHLIRNAQDATPDEGRIIVRLFKRNERAIVEVQDNGSGMDKEFIRERLFRPFDSTKGKTGMGIGVYETRDYIHKLGGDVEVISRVGEGTTFRIRLAISDTP